MNTIPVGRLSLTALTKYVNEKTGKNIHRDTALYVLVKKNFVSDIKTITEEGLRNGVSYAYDKYNSNIRWPVYDHSIQEMFLNNIDAIVDIDEKIKAKREAEKAEKEAAKKAEKEAKRRAAASNLASSSCFISSKRVFKDDSMKFPYLHLDNFVVIDTETSGMSKNDEVIEIAIVDSDKNCLYHSTFYPSVDVNPMASKVNGFTKENLKGSPLFKDEWKKIETAIGGRPIMCHNTPFDKRLLAQTCAKYNIPFDVNYAFRGSYDSRDIAKAWLFSSDYSLNTLAHLVGITREEKHEAVDDCVMTVEFIENLEALICSKNES